MTRAHTPLSPELLRQVSHEQAWHYRIVPRSVQGDKLELFCDTMPDTRELVRELEIVTGKQVQVHPLPAEELSTLLSTHYFTDGLRSQKRVLQFGDAGADVFDDLVREAKTLNSSDIHMEVYEGTCRVRIRIDGMLVERYRLDKSEYPALVNKIKIMANLDIAEKRLPQDGRIHFRGLGKFDIRVSVLPTLHGEKVVLRLLNNNAGEYDLEHLGFSAEDLKHYLEGIRRPNGILLISGPTGSGKTTTLYATLKHLNKETRNIITIEDPIEYTLDGINQVQLKESIGLSFSAALRTFLRQDPDVIMVGEIRDTETANMAIRAALTGHLVLSTIHTNSAWGTVSRLIDMGVPGFLLAGTLNTTVAQRLLRLLCPSCKKKHPFDQKDLPAQFRPGFQVEEHYLPGGCEKCYYTGYSGRKAIYEVIQVDRELAFEIKQGNMYIEPLLEKRGIKTLAENAFSLFASGQTSLEEIFPLLFNY